MPDSPARRRPGRKTTGRAVLDSLVARLQKADREFEEKIVSSEEVYRGRFMSLEHDEIERSDGQRSGRDILVHPGAIVVAPVEPDGKLLLVIQYRTAAGGALLELPAGTLDVHDGVTEDPEAAAHRELEEETGRRAGKMERLGGFYSAPGIVTEYLTLFLATDLRPAHDDRLAPDEDEQFDLVELTLDDGVAAVEAGVIEDAKSVAGILWLDRRRREGK